MIDTRKLLHFPDLYDRDTPLIVCPIDDSLISGPVNGLEKPYSKLKSIISAQPSAILTFSGMVERNPELFLKANYIINLSASTTRSAYTKKVLIGSIETALSFHACAAAVHINLSSIHADEMLAAGGEVVEQARRYGLPVVGIIYPRGEREGRPEDFVSLKAEDPDAYSELVAHCVQVGVDMGFDLIKTQYTGSVESFRRVMNCAGGVPVVIAGGPLIDEDDAISNAVDAVKAGAAGISYARNVFGRPNPEDFIQKITKALADTIRD